MKHTFLIVGKSFSSLARTIEDRGDEWLLLKDSTKAVSDLRVICADFSDTDEMLNIVSEIDTRIDGVISIYENYIIDASLIAKQLGLPALPLSSAEACTDKVKMRKLFNSSSEQISPDFKEVASLDEAIGFANSHSYPLILKPANLAKSLLVLKSENKTELEHNFKRIEDQILVVYKKHAPNKKPKILIEEFLQGSIHSVDAFVCDDGKPIVLDAIVDYQTGYDIGYDDNFHYSRILPTSLDANQQAQLKHVALLGCQALGMRNSAAHIEIIMTNKGPRIVEIGARNGGYRERMHKLANGIDVLDLQLDIKLGLPINAKINKREPCAVLELFPKSPGEFVGISNQDKLSELPSLQYFKVKQKPGEFVGKAGDGYKMCAIVILHNSDYAQFKNDLEYVNENCKVLTT